MSTYYRIVSSADGRTIQTSRLVTLMLVILLNPGLPMRLLAQQNDIKFDCISVQQGLSQSSVYSIIQDRQGFMWFATASGLNRYDGYDFTVYKPDPIDSTSLSGIIIYGLLEDNFGDIWVATRGGGLNKFNRETEQFTHYTHDPNDRNSISTNNLSLVYEDRSGILWIGTYGGGLNKFDRKNGRFIHYKHDPDNPNSLSGNYVSSIFEDRSGRLWIGTASNGLNKFDKATDEFTRYKHDSNNSKSLSNDLVRSIHEDRSGNLWVGTSQGLNRLEEEKNQFIQYYHDPNNPKSLSHDRVFSVFEDRSGRLWVGTNWGLNKLVPSPDSIGKGSLTENVEFIHYIPDPLDQYSLSDNNIISIYEDRSGTLWFGTNGGGVCTYGKNKAKFVHYKHNPDDTNSLSKNLVMSLFEDRSALLWIGTSGGLDQFDRQTGQFIHYKHDPADPNSLSSDVVWSIAEDRTGILWIGTRGGLDKFDRETGKFTHYRHDPNDPASLNNSGIRSLYVDMSGNLWVGTFRGLNNLILRDYDGADMHNERFVRYQHDPSDSNSLSSGAVFAINEDDFGTIWIGTTGGLNRFDRETGEFVQYKNDPADPKSLSNNVVLSIYEDLNVNTEGERILWVGTAKGLNKLALSETKGSGLNNASFIHYSEKDGLPGDVIIGILGDDVGNIWVSTDRGLSKFDPETETFKNYDQSDGVQSLEFTIGAYHKSRSGELFFGGGNGFNAFYPDSINDNEYIPPIVLTDFRIFDKPAVLDRSVNTIEEIDLSYKQNHFSFEFAALDYTTPEKNQYAYKLEGLDEDWIYSGTRRYASYTNLPGGEYVFRVKGSNNDGIWNEEGISVRITITPPFWETWWFRILGALSLVVIVFFGYRIKTKNIQAQKEVLEVEVAERTEQLQNARDDLEDKVDERTKELDKSRGQYRQLAQRLLNVQDEERERFSRDIHDSLGQYLATLALQNGLIKKRAHDLTPEEVIEELDEIDKSIREAIDECHRISFELSPPSLKELGIVQAINEVVTHFSEQTGVEIVFEESLNGKALTAEQDLTFFRILQESLNNIQKHASAKRIQVRLYEDDGNVRFSIEDDGSGFNMDEIDRLELHESMRGLGLVSMRERVSNLNGQFEIVTKIGEGTKVLVGVPLQKR